MKRLKQSLILSCIIGIVWSNPVPPEEAVRTADLWMAMELNFSYRSLSEEERVERINRFARQRINYLTDEGTLSQQVPAQIRAYVIEYEPAGFCVVSADDRIEPVLVFSADTRFRWDEPERNFMRDFLTKILAARLQNAGAAVHPDWIYIRPRLNEDLSQAVFESRGRDIYILWPTARWGQLPYYNDTVAVHNGSNPGIPTGCVATAMAIKMKFHGYPGTGSGTHSYNDSWGMVQYSHSVNYAGQSYNWSAMPGDNLTQPNAEVARIMYHAGVAQETDYEDTLYGGSGAPVQGLEISLNTYFQYKGTEWRDSGHVETMKSSIIARSPVIFGYIFDEVYGHAALACGYREPTTPYFYINCGWGGANNGWYSLTDLPPGNGIIMESCPYGVPGNWYYADSAAAGAGLGTIQEPYGTLTEAEAAHPSCLFLKQGSFLGSGNVPITFRGEQTIQSYWGPARIGDRIALSLSAAVKLIGNGQLKVY